MFLNLRSDSNLYRPNAGNAVKLLTVAQVIAGIIFCALGLFAYLPTGFADLHVQEVSFSIGWAGGRDFHASYSVHDHPMMHALRIVVDFAGAIGLTASGVFFFGSAIALNAKADAPLTKKIESLAGPWIYSTLVAIGVFALGANLPALIQFA